MNPITRDKGASKLSQRQVALQHWIEEHRELKVEQIAIEFGVSRETVRRDLAKLAAMGMLRRVHGGAQRAELSQEAPFHVRQMENRPAKLAIAQAAASLLLPDCIVMIDAGTTTEAFAAALAEQGRFTVITNSIGVALQMGRRSPPSKVYLLGGECRPEAQEVVGSVTLHQLTQFRADHAVLTVGAIDAGYGVMDFDLEEAMVARAMIAQAQKLTLIADHSKFDRVGLAKVCDLSAVHRIVTDAPVSSELATLIREHGIELVVVPQT